LLESLLLFRDRVLRRVQCLAVARTRIARDCNVMLMGVAQLIDLEL
jgi:hypothetical protein